MPALSEPLSEREMDVLQAIAQGASNKEIASALDISPNTVKVHVRNLFGKLGAASRTEAVTLAIQQGLLPDLLRGVIVEDEDAATEAAAGTTPSAETAVDPPPDAVMAPNAVAPTPRADAAVAGIPPARGQRTMTLLTGALLLVVTAIALTAAIVWQLRPVGGAPAPPPFVATEFADSGWSTARPLDTPRSALALVSSGLDLYAIGGATAQDAVSADLLRYDGQAQLWQPLAAKPTAVRGAAAAIVSGQIYVAGGRTADGAVTAIVEVYSPANNAWRSVAPLPVALSDSVALAWDNRLYLFGGDNGTAAERAAYVFDPLSNGWRPLPALPTARRAATGGVIADRAVIVGGTADGRALRDCARLDLTNERWESCAPLLTARSGASAAVLFNRLYLFGGAEAAAGGVSGEQYDPAGDVWQLVNIPPLADARSWHALGAAAIETRIYLVGGLRDGQPQADAYSFNPLPFQFFFPSTSSGAP